MSDQALIQLTIRALVRISSDSWWWPRIDLEELIDWWASSSHVAAGFFVDDLEEVRGLIGRGRTRGEVLEVAMRSLVILVAELEHVEPAVAPGGE